MHRIANNSHPLARNRAASIPSDANGTTDEYTELTTPITMLPWREEPARAQVPWRLHPAAPPKPSRGSTRPARVPPIWLWRHSRRPAGLLCLPASPAWPASTASSAAACAAVSASRRGRTKGLAARSNRTIRGTGALLSAPMGSKRLAANLGRNKGCRLAEGVEKEVGAPGLEPVTPSVSPMPFGRHRNTQKRRFFRAFRLLCPRHRRKARHRESYSDWCPLARGKVP